MPRIARFTVKSPAQKPSPPGPPVPDSSAVYQGTSVNDMMFSPKFGPATVSGGTRVGNKWVGCTYVAPPFVIPGNGDVELV